MELLYQMPPGWHYRDENGEIHFIVSKEAFEQLKKEKEKK